MRVLVHLTADYLLLYNDLCLFCCFYISKAPGPLEKLVCNTKFICVRRFEFKLFSYFSSSSSF